MIDLSLYAFFASLPTPGVYFFALFGAFMIFDFMLEVVQQ